MLLELAVPAKINLHLRVGPPRADGFHPLLTWMATVGWYDRLRFSWNSDPVTASEPVVLSCDDPSLPCDGSNLVTRAGRELSRALLESGRTTRSVAIHLEKKIPSGGGLGGGSADGAFTLMGLNQLCNGNKTPQELSDLAARLGSDLSFFMFGPSSICKSRGEAVRPIARPAGKTAVLFLPPIAMPTPAVFRRFDEMKLGHVTAIEVEPDWTHWASLSAEALLGNLVNDLESPAFSIRPDLGEFRREIEKRLGRTVRMSGSGSSLFTLYDMLGEAQPAAEMIADSMGIRAVAVPLAPSSVNAADRR